MNIVSILIILITCAILIFSKDKGFHLFLFACTLALYTNLGSFLNLKIGDSFTREYFVLCVLIIYKLLNRGKEKKTKNGSKEIMFLTASVIIGILLLICWPIKANIAPMNIIYDSIVLEGESLEQAKFSMSNIAALGLFSIFVISIYLCREYFTNREYVNKMINFFIKTIIVFFIVILVEAIMVNLFPGDNYRKFLLYIFGAKDKTKIFISTVRFFGIKSTFGFYTEPSYVAGPLLVFYLLFSAKGEINRKYIIMYIASFIVALLSSSTNSLLVCAFGGFILLRKILINMKFPLKKRVLIILSLILIAVLLLVILSQIDFIWNNGLKRVFDKLYCYITMEKSPNPSIISGYIRRYGNHVCYSVLKTNPLFGVGIGTTRGYGLIPSMLATFGIVGTIAMFNFYRVLFNIKITKENILFAIILVALLTGLFSFSHSISCIIVPLLIAFNKYNKEIILCLEEKN